MPAARQPRELEGVWAPYAPTRDAPWGLRRVIHLHRRAGFAATWREAQRDLADGPQRSVERILAGKASEAVPDDFEHRAGVLARSAVATRAPGRLEGWWAYRMAFGPDPLAARRALL